LDQLHLIENTFDQKRIRKVRVRFRVRVSVRLRVRVRAGVSVNTFLIKRVFEQV